MDAFNSKFDDTDWRILRELQDNARLSYTELGRRVNLSAPAVQERVKRLENAGIIAGYHVTINPKKLGLPIMSLTRLHNVESRYVDTLADVLRSLPQVINCYQLVGQDEFHAQIVAESVEALEEILVQFKPYASMTSSIVIQQVVHQRPITKETL